MTLNLNLPGLKVATELVLFDHFPVYSTALGILPYIKSLIRRGKKKYYRHHLTLKCQNSCSSLFIFPQTLTSP